MVRGVPWHTGVFAPDFKIWEHRGTGPAEIGTPGHRRRRKQGHRGAGGAGAGYTAGGAAWAPSGTPGAEWAPQARELLYLRSLSNALLG